MCRFFISTFLAVILLGTVTEAAVITEDFEDNSNPTLGGFDPMFNHEFGADEFGRPYMGSHSFNTARLNSPGHSLFIGSGTDRITFNLGPNEYVDSVEVWMICNQTSPAAYFHAIGSQGELLQQIPANFSGPLVKFDTFSASLGAITEVRLTGPEGYFDDLKINIAPEPCTILLFVIGAVSLRRRCKPTRVVLGLAPLFLFIHVGQLSADPIYQAGESPTQSVSSESQQIFGSLSSTGTEVVDIVFVLDGSGSITPASWELEKAGVRNTFFGPQAFIPADGTVAIAVVKDQKRG